MLVILDRLWRAARFTSSYADPLTDSESEEENFEDGLDFNDQDEDIAGLRRRISDEAAVSRVGEALNQTLGADRDEEAAPREHFSPVQVRFPVNAPALRPPIEATMPNVVDFDVENGLDGDKAQDHARAIKVEFDPNDVKFWFSQIENEMVMASIKSQWLKKSVLQRNLPNKQKEDVKAYLVLQQTEAGNSIYKDVKNEIIRIYAPKPQDSYAKALTRTMVGLPSQLGYQIVNDICKKPRKLEGCCCAQAALAIWSLQLPVNIRAHISDKEFTRETYKDVFEAADKVFNSARQVSVAAVAVDLDETQSAFAPQNQPQVAAIRGGGRGRGNRGGRGRNNRGGQSNQSGNASGGQSNKPQNQNQGQSQGQGQSRGPRHSSNPPESCCSRHYRHGADAWFCLAPLTCPWVNKVAARP